MTVGTVCLFKSIRTKTIINLCLNLICLSYMKKQYWTFWQKTIKNFFFTKVGYLILASLNCSSIYVSKKCHSKFQLQMSVSIFYLTNSLRIWSRFTAYTATFHTLKTRNCDNIIFVIKSYCSTFDVLLLHYTIC